MKSKYQIIVYDIPEQVSVRKYPVNELKLVQTLKAAKSGKHISNGHIADLLDVPKTMVEHWFRTDKYRAIPPAELWYPLKALLGITLSEFDAGVTTFEIREGVYDKSNRVYGTGGYPLL